MRVPVEILVLLCVAVGIVPTLTVGPILAPAARAALGGQLPEYSLAIWHGLNLPLAMSAIATVGGLLLYAGLQRFIDLHRLVHLPRGGRDAFMLAQRSAIRATRRLTMALQNGSLQRYLLLLVGFALAAGVAPLLQSPGPIAFPWNGSAGPMPNGAFLAVWVIGVAATLATVAAHRQRLLALVLIGAVGLVVSLAFVWFSAPDLALTQILVEVVTVILMMLALRWLPEQGAREARPLRKARDLVIAVAAGAGIAALAFAVLGRPLDSISPYFLQTAVPQGGGSNVVNVILVDYRGFDTFGEITVLGIAGIVIWALVAGARGAARPGARAQSAAAPLPRSLLLAVISRLLLPLATLASVYLFLRGHNLPGGGFIAGLVLAIALILQFVANGEQWVSERASTDFRPWIGWGLLVAGATGIASWLLGAPFLTSTYDYPVWPIVGAVPLASAALFDLGVYLTVVGATLVALLAITRMDRTEADR
jgi:multicomponent K+:H+ antiporter subunit A